MPSDSAPHRSTDSLDRIRRAMARCGALAADAGVALYALADARRTPTARPRKHDLVLSLGLLDRRQFQRRALAMRKRRSRPIPKWGLAHAVLARTYLALGDGVGAEAELGRAAANGFDMKRGHQMLAAGLAAAGRCQARAGRSREGRSAVRRLCRARDREGAGDAGQVARRDRAARRVARRRSGQFLWLVRPRAHPLQCRRRRGRDRQRAARGRRSIRTISKR